MATRRVLVRRALGDRGTSLLERARLERMARLSDTPHPKLVIRDEGGRFVLAVPYTSRDGTDDNIGQAFTEVDRPGRDPLLIRSGGKLRTITLDLLLASTDHQRPVEELRGRLHQLARTGDRIRLAYGAHEHGWWRLTDLNASPELRQHGTNNITRIVYTATFTRASDLTLNVGPVSGGVKPSAGAPSDPKPSSRTHTVKAGDTLWALAVRFYKDGTKWRRIADANGVKDPRKLQIGHRLRIP